jgi:enoyl-CoA hydratase/carnithine racemase
MRDAEVAERVKIALADGVADVRFARGDKMNALDEAQFRAIADAIARLEAMSGLRVVVLSGEGRAFCAGVDLDALAGDPALRDLMPRSHGIANLFQQAAWGWRALPVPVIAAVHGVAYGAGFQLMLGADVRISTPDAKLSLMEARWGLAPDVAGIALLRGLVRDDLARELTYTARVMSGTEAAAIGVVTRTAPDPYASAMTLAQEIAGQSPAAILAGKRLLNLSMETDVAEILLAESREQEVLLASSGHAETLRAAREKRAPRFDD